MRGQPTRIRPKTQIEPTTESDGHQKDLIERLLRFIYAVGMDTPQIPAEMFASCLVEEATAVRLVPTSSQPNTTLSLSVTADSSQLGRWNQSTWRNDAACTGMDTLIFFPIGETGPALPQVNLARKVCSSCPVKDECLEFAIATIQNDGIWGGTTEDERRLIKRARRAAARRAAKLSAA
jgi:WhiB family transcriptional regulator, redox-sensing transcriptional regulator